MSTSSNNEVIYDDDDSTVLGTKDIYKDTAGAEPWDDETAPILRSDKAA